MYPRRPLQPFRASGQGLVPIIYSTTAGIGVTKQNITQKDEKDLLLTGFRGFSLAQSNLVLRPRTAPLGVGSLTELIGAKSLPIEAGALWLDMVDGILVSFLGRRCRRALTTPPTGQPAHLDHLPKHLHYKNTLPFLVIHRRRMSKQLQQHDHPFLAPLPSFSTIHSIKSCLRDFLGLATIKPRKLSEDR